MKNTHPVKGEIKDTLEAETEFDTIVYKKRKFYGEANVLLYWS